MTENISPEPATSHPDNFNSELYSRKNGVAEWLFTTAILLGDQGYEDDETLLATAAALVQGLTEKHFHHPYGKPVENIPATVSPSPENSTIAPP